MNRGDRATSAWLGCTACVLLAVLCAAETAGGTIAMAGSGRLMVCQEKQSVADMVASITQAVRGIKPDHRKHAPVVAWKHLASPTNVCGQSSVSRQQDGWPQSPHAQPGNVCAALPSLVNLPPPSLFA